MAKLPVFDTSVFSPFKKQIEREIAFALLPSIVLYELIATNIDDSTLKKYERWRNLLNKNERLLTPTATDWLETAKAVRRLYLKKTAPASKLKTLQNDGLIARLAVKNRGFVVTQDIDDYEILKREMPALEIVSGDYFFQLKTMALSKKNKRKIIVGQDVFYWIYKFQKDVLRLTVMTEEKTHSRLICDFKYKNLWLYFKELVKDDEFYNDKLLIITEGIVTPWVVRQVIDNALQKGWKPFAKGKDYTIKDIEDKIDINFWTESTMEERKSKIPNPQSAIK
jgi:predicted nucleic acid-binding protein